jgi:hypothetical protein
MELKLIKLENLVRAINRHSCSGDVIELGEFEARVPRKDALAVLLEGKKREYVGKYPLLRTTYRRGTFSALGVEKQERIGYVFVESGTLDDESDYGGSYEAVRLRLKKPIELRHGIIPNCSVKLVVESEDCTTETERADHTRLLGLFWVKKDLTRVLPTEWFLT